MEADKLLERVERFLRDFGYRVLEWDGVEITVRHARDGEPFARQEFLEGTPTDIALADLEDAFRFQGIPGDFRHEI